MHTAGQHKSTIMLDKVTHCRLIGAAETLHQLSPILNVIIMVKNASTLPFCTTVVQQTHNTEPLTISSMAACLRNPLQLLAPTCWTSFSNKYRCAVWIKCSLLLFPHLSKACASCARCCSSAFLLL